MTSKVRVFALSIWLLLLLFSFWTLWTPVPFWALKMGFLGSVAVLIVSSFWLFRQQRTFLAVVGLVCLGSLASVSLWPAHTYSKGRLQKAYVSSLQSYLDTKYVWGGENRRGIDCSGLVRRAMIDALISRGWQEANPSLWRSAAQIWWYDCAARNMKDGSDWRFQAEFATSNLNEVEDSRLKLGDLAVTKTGIHVLAFVGERTWIQADPNLANGGDKVILTAAPSKSGWFGQKMVICRWKLLES